ncbi:hypothetical protein GPECTOR_613g698 [Gonium pectorale]|uniref:Uncharacterized protein n=1 Tax=Gonium pectorale TaxID=33097 RepID=A0A150FUC5_GONPE|nr:hypothetical protein GPECTOR_613g698 [Gonium pectorale]|eukprot:KXZ41243.1 hypothetical protein GPECTOR_613g698 [Gonium pectorale]
MIGSESMRRNDEVEKDELRCGQAVVHYYDWTQHNLVKALNWESWVWYRTVYKLSVDHRQ